jgi:hypothetical protein
MTAPMKRFASCSLVAATLALAPTGVFAQTTPTPPITNPLEVEFDGDSLNGEMKLFVTAQQCETSDGKYKFSAKYTSPVPVLEAWIGKGSTDCSTVDSRQRSTAASSTSACRRVYLSQESTTQLSFEIRPRDLFWTNDTSSSSGSEDAGTTSGDAGSIDGGTADATVEDAAADAAVQDAAADAAVQTRGCDLVSNQTYTLYILPLAQATDVGGNIAQPVTPSTPSTLKAIFTLYTKRPSAPGGLKGGNGESQLSIKFTINSGAPQMTRYRAYFDWGTGGDGECGSGALVGGGASPQKGANVTSVDTQSGKAELNDLDAKGIDLYDTVAASVVTVDPAGSESYLAEPICLTRLQTDNFLDVCARDPKCKNGFDSCSLRPGARAGGAWSLGLLLSALALAFVIRRRGV